MSMRQVIREIMKVAKDPAAGMEFHFTAYRDAAAAEADNDGRLARVAPEFRFQKWRLADKMTQADKQTLTLRPASGDEFVELTQEPDADKDQQVEALFETFNGDADLLQDSILIAASAFASVLSEVLRRSQLNQAGPIINVQDTIRFDYGARSEQLSSTGGWRCTFTITERSSE